MNELNDEQRAVVSWTSAPLLVAAIAGAGKTTALMERIAEMVRRGADPDRILAVTFSVKAAKQMTDRLERLGCHGVRVSTFHSLALQIVRSERPELVRWKVDDSDRYRICVKDAVSYRHMDWKSADVTHLLAFIGRCKAAGAFPEENEAKVVELATELYRRKPSAAREPNLCAMAYAIAETIRCERQLLTFDDMLLEAWALLARQEPLRIRWASRWDHVLQDEAQDENFVQHELAALLARDHRSYTIVGDPAQSIYRFRGADPGAMLRFQSEWGADIVRMGRNYRCGTKIVDLANNTLKAMPLATHLGVKMIAERSESGEVKLTRYEDFDAEGEGVTERILESHEDGRDWRDHVVLFRTNAQSRGIEESLLGARVPYALLGGTNFYERREVRDLLAYLRIAAGRGSFEDVRRSINTPFRYLGKVFVDGIEDALADPDITPGQLVERVRAFVTRSTSLQQRQRTSALSWCQMLEQVGKTIIAGAAVDSTRADAPERIAAMPSTILDHLVSDLRYNDWLTRDEGAESPENNRVSNVRELVRAAGRFPTVGELLTYVDDTLLRAAKAKRETGSSDVVTLCSIHRSKGLEWPVVYVIGCNDRILPHAHAEDRDEERRLFYVAATRAADVLELSYVRRAAVSSRVMDLQPSPFLTEADVPLPVCSEAS
jgi:DNA helicase-2/ATP-dependent DNA helicase PcrA